MTRLRKKGVNPFECEYIDSGSIYVNYGTVICTAINTTGNIFIPKKYYNSIQYITFTHTGHELWTKLIDNAKLKYDDMDTMLKTYHDSDSAKDFNPIYYIVNRPECTKLHTLGVIFDKFNFK